MFRSIRLKGIDRRKVSFTQMAIGTFAPQRVTRPADTQVSTELRSRNSMTHVFLPPDVSSRCVAVLLLGSLAGPMAATAGEATALDTDVR